MENNYQKLDFNKKVDERIRIIVPQISRGSGFTDRKVTDTPADNFQVTPRRYVNMFGSVASRPSSTIAVNGQKYFNTDTKVSMNYFNGNWYDGVGSIVASN